MKSFFSFIKEFQIPKKGELQKSFKQLSKKQLVVFVISSVLALISTITILWKVNSHFTVEVPAKDGKITEGIIGMPTLVNPVLTVSNADKDITNLIYSGLTRKSKDGTIILDLAESYEFSKDKLTYTFKLKKGLTFHDGSKLTAKDVEFTIDKIKNPFIKSPYINKWENIEVEAEDDLTVIFYLDQIQPSFLENTTIGILPMKIWKDLNDTEFLLSKLNIESVGSGPYYIKSVSKNENGTPESYNLKRFKNFALGVPYIKYFEIVSYPNEQELIEALLSNKIDQAGSLSPKNAEKISKDGHKIYTAILPRNFGLFYNKNKNGIFEDKAVIKAFNIALNKQRIINDALLGYGITIDHPILRTLINTQDESTFSKEKAIEILEEAEWKLDEENKIRYKDKNPLSFSISTGDDPELTAVTKLIKYELETIGARVEIKNYETGTLKQIIRERNYEGLFFGQVINNEADLYAFWHSSQTEDPGLNIALYKSSKIDTILENAQKTLNFEDKIKKYKEFIQEFKKDTPVILIYAPQYLYATKSNLKNVLFETIIVPSDRFNSVYNWHINSDYVWKIFAN
ncbi:MAG: ABC transporter substrate-binding protein [Patescibacteria group bacterium]|nr:ABC transporter substrate-binding protein [Patescibacteria group bacterium]